MSNNEHNFLEQQLLKQLSKGSHDAFAVLFRQYYKDLVLYAGTIIREQVVCEDIVQNLFLKLWKEREQLMIRSSLKSFLITAVRNRCLDHIRHLTIREKHHDDVWAFSQSNDQDTEKYVFYSILNKKLEEALHQLTPACRQVFEMNRFEHLKYHEIASQLQISQRAVEDRMSKALKQLRVLLKDFFLLMLFFFIK